MKAKRCVIASGMILMLFSGDLQGDSFLVINTNDSGAGSLRNAMTMANDSAGTDTIYFNIPGIGPHTILPNSQLPELSDPAGVFIDGLSQPGATAGLNPPATAILQIEIKGTNAGASHGLDVRSSNNTIQGLVINSFAQNGISILGTPGGTTDNRVYCNFIGTDPAGAVARENGRNHASFWAGVTISVPLNPPPSTAAYHNRVDGNLISANYTEGVSIMSCPPGQVYENVVHLNYIGTDLTGRKDLGNIHDGVYIGEAAYGNLVMENLISGNGYSGVGIMGYYDMWVQWLTRRNYIVKNVIGLTVDHFPLPNSREGVSIGRYGESGLWGYATNNTVGPDNIIACNGRNGILVEEHWSNTVNADSNRITENSIYDNGLLGIDLGNDGITLNDSMDLDSGPNQFVNYPVIDTAYFENGKLIVDGSLVIETDPTGALIELYRVKQDGFGNGEGKDFLGSMFPDATGAWHMEVTGVVLGDTLTATTTDNRSNTSEFCRNVTITGSTGIAGELIRESPESFGLSQNFPNPFNASTAISYRLPGRCEIVLKVYNVHGEEIRTLVDEIREAGEHVVAWDGLDKSDNPVPSGVYIFRIKTESYAGHRKSLFIK